MKTPRLVLAAVLLLTVAACSHPGSQPPAPVAFALPDSTTLIDGATGLPMATVQLLRRIDQADIVLLGEVHDNAVDHALRGALITAFASRRPAIVFEQFARAEGPMAPPQPGESLATWLDRNGFDRRSWQWPLHQPVVDAAIAHGRSLWGTGLSRDALRSVVRDTGASAPPELRRLMNQAPLDSTAKAKMDRELVEGHCGQLPASSVPGMRAAQETRDASMAAALLAAGVSGPGPAWLIAGNGHVANDVAVPRILRVVAPGKTLLSVGLLERQADGAMPAADERRVYDVVIVTPRATREDPCRGLR